MIIPKTMAVYMIDKIPVHSFRSLKKALSELPVCELYVFDLDRVLKPWDTDTKGSDDQWYADGLEAFQYAQSLGSKVVIATNQGGPACRQALNDKRYPTYQEVKERLNRAHRILKPDLLLVSWGFKVRGNWVTPKELNPHRLPCSFGWRKPAPGMITHALSLYEIRPQDALMIGDSFSDIEAAKNAQVSQSILVRMAPIGEQARIEGLKVNHYFSYG